MKVYSNLIILVTEMVHGHWNTEHSY